MRSFRQRRELGYQTLDLCMHFQARGAFAYNTAQYKLERTLKKKGGGREKEGGGGERRRGYILHPHKLFRTIQTFVKGPGFEYSIFEMPLMALVIWRTCGTKRRSIAKSSLRSCY